MFTKSCKLYPLIIVMVGMMLAAFLATPLVYAGGATKIVPADDRELPAGSFIPERRMKKIETEVKAIKAEMKAKAEKQAQDGSPQSESKKPESPEEK